MEKHVFVKLKKQTLSFKMSMSSSLTHPINHRTISLPVMFFLPTPWHPRQSSNYDRQSSPQWPSSQGERLMEAQLRPGALPPGLPRSPQTPQTERVPTPQALDLKAGSLGVVYFFVGPAWVRFEVFLFLSVWVCC